MANNIINQESDSSTEINNTVEQTELTTPTPIISDPQPIPMPGIKYISPKYESNYYIYSDVHENNKIDVLNTGQYYPSTSTVVYALEDGNRKTINIGYGCTIQLATKYTYNANSTTYVSAIANIPGIYLWGRVNTKDKYYWEESSAQYTAIEIERGSIPTVLKRHLNYTPWATWDEKSRFASVSFGGTILGSLSEKVLGSIVRANNKLTISYTKDKTKHTLEFDKNDFWDKVIPTRLVVAIQGAGGSGGSGGSGHSVVAIQNGGGGGGSGGFWLGVINLDNKHASWTFNLGQAGKAVRMSIDTGGNNGITGGNTNLFCNNTLSRVGVPQDSVVVFGGSGGSYTGLGGAGANVANVSTIITNGSYGLWTLANLAGGRGGNKTYDGDNLQDKIYYLSINDIANEFPRNQFKLSSHDGGTGNIGGGGAASYSGNGGDGDTSEGGVSGGQGAGGGGASSIRPYIFSGAGGVASISFYY